MSHYGNLIEALAYHASVGNDAWALPSVEDSQRTAALIRASRALDGRYASRFAGVKATGGQRLAWPRKGGYDFCAQTDIAEGVIPVGVVEAAYELALVELQQPGVLTPVVTTGKVTKSEAVSGAASRSFFSPKELGLPEGMAALRPTIMVAEDLLSCYVNQNARWLARVV